jgi:hypothetical protein
MRYHIFQITTGYVESASIGSLTLCHNRGFDNVLEGLYDLGLSIKKADQEIKSWHNNEVKERIKEKRLRECCETTLLAAPNRKLCAKCFMPIAEDNSVMSNRDIVDEIDKMMRSDNDSYGYDMYEALAKFGWEYGYDYSFGVKEEKHCRVHVDNYRWSPMMAQGQRANIEWHIVEVNSVVDGDYSKCTDEEHSCYFVDEED